MRNGYFQLVTAPGGFGVKIFPPEENGEDVRIGELENYLDRAGVAYDVKTLNKLILERKETVCFLGRSECPVCNETYEIAVSSDNMEAVMRFFPASSTGKRLSFDEIYKDLRFRNITSGIQMGVLQDHFQSTGVYCTDMIVAKGREPRHGKDAVIEYYFNTDVHIKPTMHDDGSVDYFDLNVINHCKKGDVLARIIPEDPGEYGVNILGNRIKPREVKRAALKFGRNIELSQDRLSISSTVDGHVLLVEGKVFVSDVYEVENVDISTGNIEFEGSVKINGNVASNYTVKAKGNVIISGVVEGAYIIAGGNIIIARGMNGMTKGTLEAGGDVVAKFIENATATAQGNITTESILHSNVAAGNEIQVTGKKGFITGGHVQAGNKVTVKTLGATLGAPTIVEVGVNPQIKARYIELQKEIAETVKIIKNTQPVLANFTEKKAKGVRFTEEQMKYVKNAAQLLEVKKNELGQKSEEMKELQLQFDSQKKAEVEVQGVVYPGTTIIIGDVSTVVQSSYQYCRFTRVGGDVKMVAM